MCPFNAISIVNLPKELDSSSLAFQYGENLFRIYNLLIIRENQVIGLLGENGIGKSTMINILSGSIVPNFGNYDIPGDHNRVIRQFKGSEVQKYYKSLYNKQLKVVKKIQNIDKLLESKYGKLTVKDFILQSTTEQVLDHYNIQHLADQPLNKLSGGELQRIYCCYIINKKADVYIFDEPTNYLDISQRIKIAKEIRNLVAENKYVIVVDHDIAFLDYVSDKICILYGKPGAYGILSTVYQPGNAINSYFDGFLPMENIRIRKDKFKYNISIDQQFDLPEEGLDHSIIKYPSINIKYPGFKLEACNGNIFSSGSVNVILGKNGTGKSSFIHKLADTLGYKVSIKPQYPNLDKLLDKYPHITVQNFIHKFVQANDDTFRNDVLNTINIKHIMDKEVSKLSGGELQKISIIYCLGREANIYMIDEPSASLDIHQRINVTRAIKRYIMNTHKIAFIVEHDITMSFILANNPNSRVIIFKETMLDPNQRYCLASKPQKLEEGMNDFLKDLDITFRKSFNSKRYRINRINSTKDREQKNKGQYFMTT